VSAFSPIFFWKSENPFQRHLCKQNPKPFPTENSLSKPSQAIQETFDEKSRLDSNFAISCRHQPVYKAT